MKCPKCVEQKKVSTLRGGGWGVVTDMCSETYYDEDGKHHDHDPNGSSRQYRCSNGHDIHVVWYSKCPNCDYNKDRSKAFYYPEGSKTGVPVDMALLQVKTLEVSEL